MEFETKRVISEVISWIQSWFSKNGPGCNAILGMSGGKDSTICAKLLVEALGKDRVIGVMMPDVGQGLNEADKICDYLGIRSIKVPIDSITKEFNNAFLMNHGMPTKLTDQTIQNIPPRVRMCMLYAISQSMNGRVINTCNLSENWIGYSTRYGDDAGDMSPMSFMTVSEIKQIGYFLGIPHKWVDKIPDDGLPCSSPDEEKLGFTYESLDKWIRNSIPVQGHCHDNPEHELRQDKIDRLHRINEFKTRYMDCFDYTKL